MNARSFHLTAQGTSHIKKNKECQDASTSYQDENCAVAVVCDGHGGDDYVRSAIGSKFGCTVAEKNIKDFCLGIDKETFFSNPDKHLRNLEATIINEWNESISAYHSENPFQDSELSLVSEKARKKYVEKGEIWSAYGTTLIAVAMNHDYWLGIHIGDGKCVAVNPAGEFKQPIPWDPKCFLNATTSICDSDAIERFRHFYSRKLPAAVFVGSDGIDDCFKNNEQLHNLYKTVLYSFATTDFEEAYEELADYLPRLSAKGSGDDVSIAALLDFDLIPELSIVKEYDREKEKARVEENARKQAEKDEAEKRRVEEEHARFQKLNNARARKEAQGRYPQFCERCGRRIRPDANFCSYCGYRINFKETPENRIDLKDPISDTPDTRTIVDIKDSVLDTPDTEKVINTETTIPETDISLKSSTETVRGDDAAPDSMIDEVSVPDNSEEGKSSDSSEEDSGSDQREGDAEEREDQVSTDESQTGSQDMSDNEDELENEKTLEQETDI